MSLVNAIESILFVSVKPLSVRQLANAAGTDDASVRQAVVTLREKYQAAESGIMLLERGDDMQFVTAPDQVAVVKKFTDESASAELTRPSLETLTIIAYRGPVTKAEIELIRGVNCTLILRNLLMRGLTAATEDRTAMRTTYHVTFDFLRFLGVQRVEELPDYARLHNDRTLLELLATPAAEPVPLPAPAPSL